MKKLLLCLLTLAMLLSCLTLTSCEKEIEDIDGLTAEEAYDKAIASFDSIERYQFESGVSMKIFGIRFFSLKDYYYTIYNGDDLQAGLSENALKKIKRLEKYGLDDILDGLQEEIIYVDDVCYVTDGDDKYKFTQSICPVESSDYEIALDRVLEHHAEDAKCYKDGDEYIIQIAIDNPLDMELDLDASEEVYTVRLDEQGRISKVMVEAKMMGIMKFTFNVYYSYEDVPEVTAPADAADYRNASGWGY